jgi:hypothetical protein
MLPKVLLIDSDAKFAHRLLKEAERQGAEVDWYRAFAELGRVGRLGDYDCVIAGLTSDPVTGIEIAQYATAFFSDLPVVLVNEDNSPGDMTSLRRLPAAVQARIPKEVGASTVLQTALDMCVVADEQKTYPPRPRARATRYPLTA